MAKSERAPRSRTTTGTAKKGPAQRSPAKKSTAARAATSAPRKGAPKAGKAAPTGRPTQRYEGLRWSQSGDDLTTAQGLRVDDTDNSLTVGERGATLLEDHHLREKITHFDHERIPERVVHARGAGAHGTFEATEGAEDLCGAAFLRKGAATPVFVRFSTVVGSRGSADTVRDVRGFATKFYTEQGNFDLVGNNIPVFFIQDGIKFPDLVHAAKPEPDREIPQAQTAHDTFWDFVSLQPESTHMLMWAMSDRAIPRSYATMEGFGVHTFRLVADGGATSLVKFHWKPVAGVHGLVWEEAQKIAGVDPDFHRRDLYERIATGNFPQWQLGVQVMADTEDQTFEGIDLLDATKLVPEELCPVRPIGVLTLHTPPSNFFAETEQVAFHPGHLVPGIGFVDDPLLAARLFSYLDTQLTRLGGPNFSQLPINQPVAEVNDNHRDGMHQSAVHTGVAPYAPNTLGAGCPLAHPDGAYVHHPQVEQGSKLRVRPQSFDDHYSQAAVFFRSLAPAEQDHLVGAFRFELGKCLEPTVVERMLGNLASVDRSLCEQVASHLGVAAPSGTESAEDLRSPALSMLPPGPGPIDGRKIALLVGDETEPGVVDTWRAAAGPAGVEVVTVGPRFGVMAGGVEVDRTLHVTASVEYDGVVLASEPHEGSALFLQEAYRHHKTVGAIDPDALGPLGIYADEAGVESDPAAFLVALGWHRHWDRTGLNGVWPEP